MVDEFDIVVEQFVTAKSPVSVKAAAGCGKTEAIVRAVALSTGKQLVLTHTNAGVAALRSRFRKHHVPVSQYQVDTIASWLLKYASAYPSMSNLAVAKPQGNDWGEVYPAAQKLFSYAFLENVLMASYDGVYIDEYQDCTQLQHAIALRLCNFLPVRVLGDPLQGIFDFCDPIVDWQTDVLPTFNPTPDLTQPYRWQNSNPELGKQLGDIRTKLLNHEPVDINLYPEINWQPWSENSEIEVCKYVKAHKRGTIAGIHYWPDDAHRTAKGLNGLYQSIEEMDCKELMTTVRRIDEWLLQENFTAIISGIKNLTMKACAERSIFSDKEYLKKEFEQLQNGDLSIVPKIIDSITNDIGKKVYRKELLNEMKNTFQEFSTEKYSSIYEAAFAARYRTRVNGRKPENRIISRTLLIKGLEFNHAIVLNADKLQNQKNFYVAITRGSESLTILSSSPLLNLDK